MKEATRRLMGGCPGPRHLPNWASLGGVDETTLEAFQALGRLFHLQRQAMKRRLTKHGAHHGEVVCLRLLAGADGWSQRDLAEILHLSRPRVTSILQGLEKSGAVRREVDPDDQRVIRVFLTPEGRRRELENRAAFEGYLNQTVGLLSEADRIELVRLLDQVSSHIAALLGPGGEDSGERVVP